jgi:hypothetical protein
MTKFYVLKKNLHVGFVFASKLNRNTNSTFAGFNLNISTKINFTLLGFNRDVARFSNKSKIAISIAEAALEAAPKSDSVRGLAITLIERLPGSLNQTGTGVVSEKIEDLSADSDKHIHDFFKPDSGTPNLKYDGVLGSNIINGRPILSISEVLPEFNPEEGIIPDLGNSSIFTEGNLNTTSGIAPLGSEEKNIIPDLRNSGEYLEIAPGPPDIILDFKTPIPDIGLSQQSGLPTAFSGTSLDIGLSRNTNDT